MHSLISFKKHFTYYFKRTTYNFLPLLRKKKIRALFVLLILFGFFWFSLPTPLFNDPYSTVIEDRQGNLMAAMIAGDGQWRFPESGMVPDKFAKAVVLFEDRYFNYHPGVNFISLFNAAGRNIRKGKVVSGGSTITMQTIRLSGKNKPRTFFRKIIEVIISLRLEISCTKEEILSLYASHAPFGGNVVGLEAASWRYFGRAPNELSWAESVTLAVLPNSPSLIYPGKNQEKLLRKRNRLLDRLRDEKIIDEETCKLSKQELLPGKPFPLPQSAYHLLSRVLNEKKKGSRIRTTLDRQSQTRMNEIVELHHRRLASNDVNNLAILVADVNSGNVLAYVGNVNYYSQENGNAVDVITAPRSTGSILKPFLYAFMLNDGELLPNTLIPDIPLQFGDFSPRNFDLHYDGAVQARRALARSLNVPAVKMLQTYGIDRFLHQLKRAGLTTLNRTAGEYGLSLILGGAEGSMWDIAGVYASMARTLNHFPQYQAYDKNDWHSLMYETETKPMEKVISLGGFMDAASIWLAFEAMAEVNRPDEEASWNEFSSSYKVAWKTGTSFGNRDAWAVGVTPSYVVAVWAGNTDGEGRPDLTGINCAAPVLFDVFSSLKSAKWFEKPLKEMEKIPVCALSGFRASDLCMPVNPMWVQKAGLKTQACPYHKQIHLDKSGKYRVNSDCEPVSEMQNVSWFILPPAQEWFYKSKNPLYRDLPPLRADCAGNNVRQMELIYPRKFSKIYVPVELDGKLGNTVFQAIHRLPGSTIHWHLDDVYAGSTSRIHQMGLSPYEGKHVVTLVDDNGESISVEFEILSKKSTNN